MFIGRARIVLRSLACALALILFATGCARRSTARLPAPPPAKIGSTETGIASWYGVPYHGRPSASGEIFDMEKLTAAHRALPFQTWVEITNLSNGKQVNVRIIDRGPFVHGRIIDLSMAAARQIDMVRAGTARVLLKVITAPVDRAPVDPAPVNPPPTNAAPVKAPPVKALDTPQTAAAGYAVQAGVFFYSSQAEALRAMLPYSDARVVEPSEGQQGPAVWRVLVGHALTLQAATALAAEVQKSASGATVVLESAGVLEGAKE